MKAKLTILFLLISLFTVGVVAAAPGGENRNFVAHLTGDQEAPTPVDTQAQGQAKFQLSKDGTELHFKLIVASIENVTQAHIHCGAPGTAGPVVAFLYPAGPPPVLISGSFSGVLSEGTITDANIIPRPDSAQCPGGVADFNDLIEKIGSGEAYVNVHTTAFPGGEIRGVIR